MRALFYSMSLLLVLGCGEAAKDAINAAERAQAANEAAQKQLEKAQGNAPTGQATPTAPGTPAPGVPPGIPNFAEALKKMGDALNKPGGNQPAVEPVDFRTLKGMLPAELDGMRRTKANGERTKAMGFNTSQADGTYKGDGRAKIRIKITDSGSMHGFVAMASMGWRMAQIERESDTGYERTIDYQGHRGLEKFNSRNNRGEMKLIVRDRYMIEVDGYNVPMDAVKAAMGRINLGGLPQ